MSKRVLRIEPYRSVAAKRRSKLREGSRDAPEFSGKFEEMFLTLHIRPGPSVRSDSNQQLFHRSYLRPGRGLTTLTDVAAATRTEWPGHNLKGRTQLPIVPLAVTPGPGPSPIAIPNLYLLRAA